MPKGVSTFNFRLVSSALPNVVPAHTAYRAGVCGRSPRRSTRLLATVSDLAIADRGHELGGPTVVEHGLTTTVCPMTATTQSQPAHTVLATVYSFPKMEPLRFTYYPSAHLQLPLRRDILQRAVVYEGDNERQGTASTKWRSEVRGSGRKLAPQKGLGRARVGDKKSPIRTGGGVAFGPKPRDFATELPKKIYDRAWRTALSYRYKKGELVVVDRLSGPSLPSKASAWWLEQVFGTNNWGKARGKSLLVAEGLDQASERLRTAMEVDYGGGDGPKLAGKFVTADDVDVKDLLSLGRIIIEHRALNRILHEHSSDLVPDIATSATNLANAIDATGRGHLRSELEEEQRALYEI